MTEDFDPIVLNKWLKGEANEEDLQEWLKELYPDDMHKGIEEALGGHKAEEMQEEEDIDSILEEIALSMEDEKRSEDINDNDIGTQKKLKGS